jgi:glutamyl-tRNA reductase
MNANAHNALNYTDNNDSGALKTQHSKSRLTMKNLSTKLAAVGKAGSVRGSWQTVQVGIIGNGKFGSM